MAGIVNPLLVQGANNPAVNTQLRTDEIMARFNGWDPQEHTSFIGHQDEIWSCAISSDNNTILSGSKDRSIIIWNIHGEQIDTLVGHEGIVCSLILINGNQILISADWENNIFVWDLPDRNIIVRLRGNTRNLYSVAISRCGSLIASCGIGGIFDMWRTDEWEHLGSFNTESEASHCILFTPNIQPGIPKIIISCEQGQLRLFNSDPVQERGQRTFRQEEIQCMAINEKSLIIGYRTGRIDLIEFSQVNNLNDFANLQLYYTFTCFSNIIRSIVITKEGSYFFAFSADQSIKVFSIPDKSLECKIDGCESFIFAGCLSRDNTIIVAGSSDRILRKWNIGERNRCRPIRIHERPILAMAISNDNIIIATGDTGGNIKLTNIQNLAIDEIQGNGHIIWALKFSPNGIFLASASNDHSVKLYNFANHELVHDFNNFHTQAVFCISFSNDSRHLVSGSQDANICVYNIENMNLVASWQAHFDSIFAVEVSLDGIYIVSGSSDYSVKVWRLLNGELVYRMRSEYDEITCLSFSPDNRYIAFGYKSGNISLFEWQINPDPENPFNSIRSFNKHEKRVKYIHFSLNSDLFVSCSFDHTIRIWRIDDYIQDYVLLGQTSEIRSAQFTSDMAAIISSDRGGKIHQWNINNVDNFDLADIRSAIDAYLFLSFIKKSDPLKKKYIEYNFGHARINLAHFYAYLGYDELLIIALREGVEIKRDIEGHSPLHFAIARGCQGCIDNILKFFCELKSKDLGKFLLFCHQIRDDFEKLIRNYSFNLPAFLDHIFYALPVRQTFGAPKANLPIILYAENLRVDLQNFIVENGNLDEVNFRIYTIPFSIPYEMGSQESLRFLENIMLCNNQRIMQTHFIKSYIKEKWNKIWSFILIHSIIYVFIIALMVYLLIKYHNSSDNNCEINYWGQSIYLILNLIELVYETIQIYALGMSYFSLWNLIDSLRLTLSLIWVILSYFVSQSDITVILFLMVFFNLIRGITCFRIFDETRYYIRLVRSAIKDSFYFLLIFSYSTFAFGVLYFMSSDKNTTITSIWTAPYELNMGELDRANSDNFLTYIYFFLASVINVIIMLNLLISILGDTFDSFQLYSDEMDNLEMAELIHETESIMFWKQNSPAAKKFIQVCQEVIVQDKSNWGGKIKHVAEMVKDLKADNSQKLRELDTKFDLMSNKIDEISRTLQDMRNANNQVRINK